MADKSDGGPSDLESASDDLSQEDRREALKKIGLYGAYAAPVLLALLAAPRQAHASVLT